MSWYVRGLRRALTFQGRANRREYWGLVLGNLIMLFGVSLLVAVGSGGSPEAGTLLGTVALAGLVVFLWASLAQISATVRRLHDTGKSGWLYFVIFLPLVHLLLVWWLVQPGDDGTNAFGPPPAT